MPKLKNILGRINTRLAHAKECTRVLEDKVIENTKVEYQKEKRIKISYTQCRVRDLLNNIE